MEVVCPNTSGFCGKKTASNPECTPNHSWSFPTKCRPLNTEFAIQYRACLPGTTQCPGFVGNESLQYFLGRSKEKLAFILIFHISGGNYLCIADSPCCSCISLSASWWINNTWVDQVDQTTKNDLNNQQTNLIYPTHPSVQSKQASSAASSNPHPNSWIQHSCWNHTCRHTSPFSKISARIDSHDAHGKTKSGAHLTCCVNTVR